MLRLLLCKPAIHNLLVVVKVTQLALGKAGFGANPSPNKIARNYFQIFYLGNPLQASYFLSTNALSNASSRANLSSSVSIFTCCSCNPFIAATVKYW